MNYRRFVAVFLAPCVVSCAPFNGEFFVDVYGGPNFGNNADVQVNGAGETDIDDVATAGGRIGCYFDHDSPLQFGAAFDGSVILLEDDADEQFDLVYLTPLALVRYGFFANEYAPYGIVQPYAGVGPSIVVAEYDGFDEEAVALGLDTRAGVSFHIPTNMPVDAGVFAEYRFTYAEPEFDLDAPFGGDDIDVETAVHHALFGLSIRWGGRRKRF